MAKPSTEKQKKTTKVVKKSKSKQPVVGKGDLPLRAKNAKRVYTVEDITDPAIIRLSSRGGVKRRSQKLFPTVRDIIQIQVDNLVGASIEVTSACKRRTITTGDVMNALKLLHPKPPTLHRHEQK
jgi:histone H3/H4